MFERFTDRARRVVVLAQEEARLQNHNYIGTEHVLLGLIHEGESLAAQALAEVGIELEAVRIRLVEVVGAGNEPPRGHIPFTSRAKAVLEVALRESLQLGHNYLAPEHLLLAIVSGRSSTGGGVGVQLLEALGAKPEVVRSTIVRRIEQLDERRPRFAATPGVEVFAAAPEPPVQGVWIVFNADGSMARPFATEIEALRCAVGLSGSQVEFTKWGQDVGRPEAAS